MIQLVGGETLRNGHGVETLGSLEQILYLGLSELEWYLLAVADSSFGCQPSPTTTHVQ